MGSSSSECSKPNSSSTSSPLSNPTQTQGSPVFSYISNLSPIKPDKTAPVAHGFLGINSPPFVFRSTQINPNRQKDCVTRAQFTRLSDAGSSRQDENVGDTDIVAEKSGMSSGTLSSDLTSSPQKTLVTNNSPHAKACCLPGNSDNYLSKIVNMDGRVFASSANLSPKSSDDIFHSQNDLFDSKESVGKNEIKDDTADEKLKIGAPPSILEQAEENDLGNSLSDIKSFESVKKLPDSDMPQSVCPKVDRESCENHVMNNQHGKQSEAENAGSGHLFEVGFSSQLACKQIAQDSEVCENAVEFTASIGEKMHDRAPKVGQHQHGISRRLQFEDAHSEKMADIGFQVSSRSAGYPRLPARPADPEIVQSAPLYKPVSPSNMFFASNMTQTVFSPQNNENYNIKVPKPSGIGLHLNSIIAKQNDSATNVSGKSEGGSLEGIEKKSLSIMSCQLRKNCSISSNLVRGASLSSNDNMYASCTSTGASSSESPYSMKPLFEPVVLEPRMELQSNKRNFNSETFDSFTDLGQSSPKKKRKKATDADDSNGCKRCNCKKTKCLKLYCDCFAAGIYCAEPCACQGCFNRPEYEDTVLETRAAIESRNPLAFAPKIIQQISEPPTNVSVDDGDFTPSSGRHKRGCNCKKSKCLKKYCECYQANVGCSDGCRCEGCDNVFGRKEEYGTIRDMVRKQGNSNKLDSSLETMLSKDGLLRNELYSSHNLTPLTPSFQCSINEKWGASRAWFSSGRYFQSPESDLNLLTPFGLSRMSAKNPDNCDMILENNTEIMDLVTFQQGFGFGNGHTSKQFSPCGPSNVNHLTPAALSNPQDWAATTSRAEIFPGNRQVPSESSLRWRRSPVTPSTHIGESKFHEAAEFTHRLCGMMDDDDVPEILKEDTVPTNAVKVSSPNKKRVSPPHGQGTELGSSSSAGLKSRKFILRGVQTISPKTPCNESHIDSGQNTDNSQSSSSSK